MGVSARIARKFIYCSLATATIGGGLSLVVPTLANAEVQRPAHVGQTVRTGDETAGGLGLSDNDELDDLGVAVLTGLGPLGSALGQR